MQNAFSAEHPAARLLLSLYGYTKRITFAKEDDIRTLQVNTSWGTLEAYTAVHGVT